jgi:arylformamidase
VTLVDLTRPLAAGMPVYPGDPEVAIEPVEPAPGVRISRMRLGTHSGTHMDAPAHFFPGSPTIDRIPPEQCCGAAVLIRGRGARVIDARALEPFDAALREARKAVFDTGWSARWGAPGYFIDHPVISEGAARYLVDRSVHLVGIDAPSVDAAPYASHRALLGAGAVIVENLANLDRVAAPVFQLWALPLAIAGGDGAPARVFAVV